MCLCRIPFNTKTKRISPVYNHESFFREFVFPYDDFCHEVIVFCFNTADISNVCVAVIRK